MPPCPPPRKRFDKILIDSIKIDRFFVLFVQSVQFLRRELRNDAKCSTGSSSTTNAVNVAHVCWKMNENMLACVRSFVRFLFFSGQPPLNEFSTKSPNWYAINLGNESTEILCILNFNYSYWWCCVGTFLLLLLLYTTQTSSDLPNDCKVFEGTHHMNVYACAVWANRLSIERDAQNSSRSKNTNQLS